MVEEVKQLDNNPEYRIPDSTKYAAIGTFIGMIGVLFLVIFSFTFPEPASSMDSTKSIAEFIEFAGEYRIEIITIILLDTIFISGYTSLFVGLWLLVRDFSEILSKVALITGLLVGLFDLVENSLLLSLVIGLDNGWAPDDTLYGTVFFLNVFIDLLSYTAGLMFAIIFLTIYKPLDRRFFLGLLLALYVVIGLTSFLIPVMLLVRSIFFVIGLIIGGIILWNEEDIPSDIIEKMLFQQQESKNEFIR